MKLLRLVGITVILVGTLTGCAESGKSGVEEFGGVSGTMRTSNTSHYSLEFTNAGDAPITAVKGRVEVLDDFGEAIASIPVELTSRTRIEGITETGEFEGVPLNPENAVETRFVLADVVH